MVSSFRGHPGLISTGDHPWTGVAPRFALARDVEGGQDALDLRRRGSIVDLGPRVGIATREDGAIGGADTGGGRHCVWDCGGRYCWGHGTPVVLWPRPRQVTLRADIVLWGTSPYLRDSIPSWSWGARGKFKKNVFGNGAPI